MSGGEDALSVQGFSVGYETGKGRLLLFENLDLRLHHGELVCFMGPNGVGKSTLIRSLIGLHPPLRGTVSMDGTRAAVVLTERVSSPYMTVEELVTYGRYPYLDWRVTLGEDDRRAIDGALKDVRIDSLRKRKLYELSDGQMQMVMIARALAQETPVLLLDEPTAHLDLNNRMEVMSLLRRIGREQGKAILVATHELDLALQMADRIWLATRDKRVLQGMPEDLVLSGAFDEVFQLKGFDLKTGKISHAVYRKTRIRLTGAGHELLWTKNALERMGYEIAEDGDVGVVVRLQVNTIIWRLDPGGHTFTQLEKLKAHLPD